MTWLITIGYLSGTIATARWIAPHTLDFLEDNNPDTSDIALSRFLAEVETAAVRVLCGKRGRTVYDPAEAAAELTQHDQAHGHYQEDQ